MCTPCAGEPIRADGSGGVQIGSAVAHDSHSLAFDVATNVWYCEVCGTFSRRAIRDLKRPCKPPTDAGTAALRRLKKALMPGASGAATAFNKGKLRREGRRGPYRPGVRRKNKAGAAAAPTEAARTTGSPERDPTASGSGAAAAAAEAWPDPLVGVRYGHQIADPARPQARDAPPAETPAGTPKGTLGRRRGRFQF